MKRSILIAPFLLLVLLALLLVGCGSKANVSEVSNPGQSLLPTAAPTPVPQITEEFKAEEVNAWSDPVFVVGNPKKSEITTQGNSLLFNLRDVETYVYKFFDKSVFEDVIVEAEMSNKGDNSDGIALICRASADGWYEYRVSNGGTYSVYIYQQKQKDRGENPYTQLDSGGSGLINARDNRLKFVCQGNSLKIFASDKEIKPPQGPIEDSTFTNGKVGVGVHSYSRVPVKIDFTKVSISKP